MELKRIIVGLDGSGAAALAARWAAEAVRDSGGEVLAVYGMGAPPNPVLQAAEDAGYGLGFLHSWSADESEESSRLVEEWCQPLGEAGVPYRAVVVHADPIPALLDTARREDADLIVVGHDGDTGFLHRLFGGLSEHLVDHAKRPVVVVPFYAGGENGVTTP